MKKYFFVLVFLSSFVLADEDKNLLITGGEYSEISLLPSPNFKWEGADKSEKGNHIQLKLKKPSVKLYLPKFKSITLVVDSAEKINIHNFEKINIHISVPKAHIDVQKSKGSFNLNLQEGKAIFSESQGKLNFKSYSASVNISQFKGSIEGVSFSGPVSIEKSNGKFNVETFSNPFLVNKSSGDLTFHSQRSNVQLKSYIGSINGFTKEGSIKGSLSPAQAHIETGSGEIRLYFLNSKARVEAQSWKGRVLAPSNFYKDRAGGVSKAYGSIRNRGDKTGNVSLKSHSGKISIF